MTDKIISHLQVRPGVWMKAEIDKKLIRGIGSDLAYLREGLSALFEDPEWDVDYDPFESTEA